MYSLVMDKMGYKFIIGGELGSIYLFELLTLKFIDINKFLNKSENNINDNITAITVRYIDGKESLKLD